MNKKEWKPSVRFVPRRKQYTGGVLVVIKPSKTKMTVNGPEVIEGQETFECRFGPNNMGVMAQTEAQEKRLLEFAADPKCDITTYDKREMSKNERMGDKARLLEKKRADAAESKLEALQNMMAASGLKVDGGQIRKE